MRYIILALILVGCESQITPEETKGMQLTLICRAQDTACLSNLPDVCPGAEKVSTVLSDDKKIVTHVFKCGGNK